MSRAQSTIDILQGDCRDVLSQFPEAYFDSIVSDPPYGLSFMGKKWDYDVPGVEIWAECLRVLKPGGHLLAFAGTRTQHRMAVRIEDAGFEIRDMIAWVYGSGFPKSHDFAGMRVFEGLTTVRVTRPEFIDHPQAEGWGTALKPALEPITVARKPLAGTVAENVLAHGTGALNIDGCRVAGEQWAASGEQSGGLSVRDYGDGLNNAGRSQSHTAGRWPANLIHDGSEEVVAAFPSARSSGGGGRSTGWGSAGVGHHRRSAQYHDAGSAARFFYCAKASKQDRGEGNDHPTVKPTALMQYLCRLVTPIGGHVLDPFGGSGSTGVAAAREGLDATLIELDPKYIEICRSRVRRARETHRRLRVS